MGVELVALRIGAADPARQAGFWAAALGWEATAGHRVVPTDATRWRIDVVPTTTPKTAKNPIHLDLTTTSLDDQRATAERLVALGGQHVDLGQTPEEGHVVLAGPEGDELCLIGPGNTFLAGCERLGSITCDGSVAAGTFWSAALGWPLVWDQDEETAIRAPDGTGPLITWGPPVPPDDGFDRLHLLLVPAADSDVDAEVRRLVDLGARPVGTDGDHVVLADPDGIRFRVGPTAA